MEVVNSQPEDIDMIFQLFDAAIEYQKKNGYNMWTGFSKDMILLEIAERRHFKIVEDGKIACIISVVYNDPVIWERKDAQPSVYLHRIVTNPDFKGRGIMNTVKAWAIDHAKQKQKQYVRMDTWGNNENLKNYYVNCGFIYSGQKKIEHAEGLPVHYAGLELSLFEIAVEH